MFLCAINHSYWSYVDQLRYRLGPHLWIGMMGLHGLQTSSHLGTDPRWLEARAALLKVLTCTERKFQAVEVHLEHLRTVLLVWGCLNLPSGNLLHNYGKPPCFFNGKIHYFDWAIFHSFLYVHQRVYPIKSH